MKKYAVEMQLHAYLTFAFSLSLSVSTSSMIHTEPWPPSGSVSRHVKICLVYLTFRFLNIWLALQEEVVSPMPNPQPGEPGYPF